MLFLSHLPLGAPVIIGILVVIAALANDGVLLLTFINQLEKTENLLPEESVVKAGMLRLRPIVMTTVPVIMGFIPLIFNLGGGGEMLQPMAAAAVGGLIFEIMVALILMPCLYVTFTRRKLKKENET
jgi:multidrug efflux pump subunit AcrB